MTLKLIKSSKKIRDIKRKMTNQEFDTRVAEMKISTLNLMRDMMNAGKSPDEIINFMQDEIADINDFIDKNYSIENLTRMKLS